MADGLVRAILYTRVSSYEQAGGRSTATGALADGATAAVRANRGISLDVQIEECRRYAAVRGWAIAAEFTDVMSGLKDARPAYMEMLQTIRTLRAQQIDCVVVVAALDRFGRLLIERVRSRDELKALGVPLHTVREGGEVSDLAANILAAVAQEESRRTGERVAATRSYVRDHGWPLPSKPALGYRRRPTTPEEEAAGAGKGTLEVDPDMAPYVWEVFERIAGGESIRQAWEWLAAALPPALRGSLQLPFTVVALMVHRAVYVARPRQGDPDVLARPIGHWPPLVTDEVFARVQQQIADHRVTPHQAGYRYLLTGVLRCPICGGRMQGFGPLRLGPGQRRYRCAGLHVWQTDGAQSCVWSCSATRVEAAVLTEVRALLEALDLPGRNWQVVLRRAWRELQAPGDLATFRAKRQTDLDHELARGRERLTRAALLLVDGELDRTAYDAVRAQVERDLAHAEAELAKLAGRPQASSALPALDVVLAQLGGMAAALEGADPVAQRAMLHVLVRRAVPIREAGFAKYHADIEWTPTGSALKTVSEQLRGGARSRGVDRATRTV